MFTEFLISCEFLICLTNSTVTQRESASETYDKMLRNPNLTAEQRVKITGMRERRRAKEVAGSSSLTDLVRTASPATQAALREAMSGLAEAKREAGFGAEQSAGLQRTVSAGGTVTMTELVRTASPAVNEALREAMSGLAEAKREAGFGGAPQAASAPSTAQSSLARQAMEPTGT